MSTSGVTDWSLTALDVVKAAMQELASIEPGQDPDPEEFEDCILRLNGLLKSWQLRGASLSHQATGTVTTAANEPSGTLDSDIRSISSARLVVSATQERPLYPLNRTEYQSLPNKAQSGTPSQFYLSRQRDDVVMYIWPVPTADATILIDYDRIIETVTANTETLDIRSELLETVYANLAVRISGLFGEAPSPELVARAARLEQQMFDAERPDSYRFETDYDYSYA